MEDPGGSGGSGWGKRDSVKKGHDHCDPEPDKWRRIDGWID